MNVEVRKKQLADIGEETIYSAKNHYKQADLINWLRLWIPILIFFFTIFSISLDCFDLRLFASASSYISLLFSTALLIFEGRLFQGETAKHLRLGDKYLKIHKKARNLFRHETIADQEFNELIEEQDKLNDEVKPKIFSLARKMARKAIEEKGETNNWFNEINQSTSANHSEQNL